MISPTVIIVGSIVCIVFLFGVVAFIGAPYVPSRKKYVARVFEHVGVVSTDTLVDIGSGDGVVLRVASGFGAKAVGYEINPVLVLVSRVLSLRDPRVRILMQNVWFARLPDDTTMVYAFSVSRDERKLTNVLQREANRLDRPLKLLCLGSPFKRMTPADTFEAYHLYIFQPLQPKNA